MKMCLMVAVLFAVNMYCICQAQVLVENHKAMAIIVVPSGTIISQELLLSRKGSNSVSAGAEELQKYIAIATGAKLSIVNEDKLIKAEDSKAKIFVGPCTNTKQVIDIRKIQPEGFIIKNNGQNVYIAGRDKSDAGISVYGTYYGCDEFLEKYLGIRWLMPGRLGEVVPKSASLKIGSVDIKQEPLLWQRHIRNVEIYGHRKRISRILKVWGVSLRGYDKFFSRKETEPWFMHQRIGARVRLKYGHAFKGWWDKYHKKYPDIFAMQPDGTRNDGNYREKFCVSNPQYWQLVAQEKIKELKADPLLTAASISPNDGGGPLPCCCKVCKSWDSPNAHGSLTDRYFRSFNEIAKLVAKKMPGRYLGCYAYSNYRVPPVKLHHLEKNLIVGFVGFNTYLNNKIRLQDRKYWLEWSKLAKQLFIRPNLFWYNMGMPVNYTHKIAQDIRFMADHGMRAADFDGLIGNWGSEGLDYYVVAKLLWNPYADVNAIVADYCNAAYGKGASFMEDYYKKLEALTNQIASAGYYMKKMDGVRVNVNIERYMGTYSDGVLKDLKNLITEAEHAIGNSDSSEVARIKLIAVDLDYVPHVRDLVFAAAAVRNHKMTLNKYKVIFERENKYFASMALNWSVSMAHDYSYIKQALSLKQNN